LRSDDGWAEAVAAAQAALGRTDFTAAAQHLERALRITPRNADLLTNLGALHARQQRLDDAVPLLEQALAVEPGHAHARRNLVITLEARGNRRLAGGQLDAGVEDLRRALALDPAAGAVESALGLGLAELGRFEEAIEHYRRALARLPGDAPTLNRLGKALMDLGRFEEARQALEAATAAAPAMLEAAVNLTAVLLEQGRLADAEVIGQRAVELAPRSPEAHNNLALVLREEGEVTAALQHFDTAIELAPATFLWRSGRLLTLSYLPEGDQAALVAEHREVGAAWVAAVGGPRPRPPRAPDPGRRLRVGYVSPDFRTHSVSYFFESFVGHHDPAAVEVTCYACSPRRDDVTARLQALVARWREVSALSDEQLAAQIAADEIDVLVDLAGHTANNRLAVFARGAAPVQMTYLGYGVTSGLPIMDYLLSDEIADPDGAGAPETVLHLPGGYLCYRPPSGSPPVAPLPAQASGRVTFGSFNNLAKLSDLALDAWAVLLAALPDARLQLKARGLAGPQARERVHQRFAARQVDPARIELAPPTPTTAAHLQLYGQVDIALDTFPYNGTTTTCEALWMGVPVVTVAGNRHMGRVGQSILRRLALDELVALDVAGYVRIAAALAADRERLAVLRGGLRERMGASPLMDGRRLARALEAAYRQGWQRAVARSG
jgi:protein O-GlcNAc transferase